MTHPVLSVVIATFNRAELAMICLESLACQTVPAEQFEIILVDNASSDGTGEMARRFCARHANARCIREPTPGVSRARNAGTAAATGEYVAFIDDDARARPDWCEQILRFATKHPHAEAFCGPYRAYFRSPKPAWFKDAYGSWAASTGEGAMAPTDTLNGTNMIFKKRLLEQMGGFSARLGPRGRRMAYGEETHLHRRIVAAGHSVFYSPSIVVEHLVRAEKMKVGWMVGSAYRNGLSAPMTFSLPPHVGPYTLYLAKQVALAPPRFFLTRERFLENRVIEVSRPIAYAAGIWVMLVRNALSSILLARRDLS